MIGNVAFRFCAVPFSQKFGVILYDEGYQKLLKDPKNIFTGVFNLSSSIIIRSTKSRAANSVECLDLNLYCAL